MNKVLLVVCVAILCVGLIGSCNVTIRNNSGEFVRTHQVMQYWQDKTTGCQYLISYGRYMTPRLARNGEPDCNHPIEVDNAKE